VNKMLDTCHLADVRPVALAAYRSAANESVMAAHQRVMAEFGVNELVAFEILAALGRHMEACDETANCR